MGQTVYVLLAEGFEEMEAVIPIDFLRRAGCEVKTVGLSSKCVKGSHGIEVMADIHEEHFVLPEDAQMIFLPGGGLGTENLAKSVVVKEVLEQAQQYECYIAAICAAPTVLHKYGMVKEKTITAFPSVQEKLIDSNYTGKAVEIDGKIITGRSPGVALDFAEKLVSILKSEHTALETKQDLYP